MLKQRLALYGLLFWAGLVIYLQFWPDPVPPPDNAPLARAIARRNKLVQLRKSSADALQQAVEKAFSDGKHIAGSTKPHIVLTGSTPTHIEPGPTEVGPIELTSSLSALITTIPADGNAYARADITTTLALPKFNFTRTFTEQVQLSEPLILDERQVVSTPIPRPRTLFGLDAGLNAGLSSAGWELGARLYPSKLVLNSKYAEIRTGFYTHYESSGRIAGGISFLTGFGRESK